MPLALDPHPGVHPAGHLAAFPDAVLMRLAGSGSLAAFDEVVARHRPALLRVARQLLHDEGLAEDALQDGLLGAWRAAGAYRSGSGTVRTWLTAIVRNRAIDARRRQSTHHRMVEGLVVEAERQVVQAAEDIVVAAETRRLVRASIDDLPEPQRRALAHHFFGERTMAEVATESGTPLGTIKSRIRLGLERLRASAAFERGA